MSINDALKFISVHPERDRIVDMYKRGPPTDGGFMWCTRNDFPKHQQNAYDAMDRWVLNHGYDSSGYVFMQRLIQSYIVKN